MMRRKAQALTAAYVQAISDRIIALGRDRVRRKREVVQNRFKEAATARDDRRGGAQRLPPPQQPGRARGAARFRPVAPRGLEAQLQAKLVELETLQRFQGRTIRSSSRSSRKSARSAPRSRAPPRRRSALPAPTSPACRRYRANISTSIATIASPRRCTRSMPDHPRKSRSRRSRPKPHPTCR